MDNKYIIAGSTLTDIADAIRVQENTQETIATTEFAKHIAAIEPSVEEYMRISDLMVYPTETNEKNYDEKSIEQCRNFLEFYNRTEGL